MHMAFTRLRTVLRGPSTTDAEARAEADACSWDAMRATYEEQAARGVPEAIAGLELIEDDRWPTSGRHRDGSRTADG